MAQPKQTPPLLGVRLSVMMFLQYAIWGAWLPLFPAFLGEHRKLTEEQVGNIGAVGALGAVIAPFIMGQIADRWLSTEKLLGILHLAGAALIWQLATFTDYSSLFVFALAYSMLYAPTMPLTNALAFHHLPDRDKGFGRVRLWGTIGWIAVGIGMGQWLLHYYTPAEAEAGVTAAVVRAKQVEGMADAFRLSAILGGLMGLFCFTLPNTPPQPGKQSIAPLEALGEIRKQPLITLFLLSLPVSCLHQFFFYHAGAYLGKLQTERTWIDGIFGVGGGGLMTIGQISEIFFLASVPLIAKKLTRKTILTIGLVAYALRFAAFAFTFSIGVAVPALALHGPVFGGFIFLAFLIVDEETTGDVRASAQGLYNLVIVGVGVVVGSYLSGQTAAWVKQSYGEMNYQVLFGIPFVATLVCLGLLWAFYPGGKSRAQLAAERGA